MTWHVPDVVWERYAAGTLDPGTAASVEAHVPSCATCRSAAHLHAGPTPELWEAVAASIRRPSRSIPLRVLARLGVPDADLVIVGASDGLVVSWSVAVGGAVTALLVAALAGVRQEFAFLLLVPFAQVLAVVAAFDATDTLREATTATSFPPLRIALLRSAAALGIAVPCTLVFGSLLPGIHADTFVWLLPALGLVLAVLVLHTWMDARHAAGVVGVSWTTVVTVAHTHLATGVAQTATAVVGCVLFAVLVLRTTSVTIGRSR